MKVGLQNSAALSANRRKLLRAVRARVLRRAHSHLTSEFLSQLVSVYFQQVDSDDLLSRSAEQLSDMLLQHLELGRRRTAAQVQVHHHNDHAVIDVVTDDMPFLVDSLSMVLASFNLNVRLIVHPVLLIARNTSGHARMPTIGRKAHAESWQHYEVDAIDVQQVAPLQAALLDTLRDVAYACGDWQAMRRRALRLIADFATAPVNSRERQETADFLQWLTDDHFTFLGSQQLTLQQGAKTDALRPMPRTALGLMRSTAKAQPVSLTGPLREQARRTQLLLVTKSTAVATVHRAARLDQISIKHFDRRGRVCGETRFLGLFTSNVYTLDPREIPMLRHKLAQLQAALQLMPGSHDAKALQHVLATYPRDELFQSTPAELQRCVRAIVNLQERRRVAVFLRLDPFRRFYSGLLYLPRDRYNTRVRERIEGHLLAALGGSEVESQVWLSDSTLARLHVFVLLKREPGAAPATADEDALERDVARLIRTWQDELRAALLARYGAAGMSLVQLYGEAFAAAYQADVAPTAALEDIAQLQGVTDSIDSMALRFTDTAGHLHLRVMRRGVPLPLSDVLPVVENLGLRVLTERPYEVEPQRAKTLWIQDFELEAQRDLDVQGVALHDLLQAAFLAIWQRQIDNDGFNRLIARCRLSWREVNVLRAYGRYLLQTGVPFSQAYMEQTLLRHSAITAWLWQLFAVKFDPAVSAAARHSGMALLNKQIIAALDAVASPDDDRILRAYLSVINASVRSNYYQHRRDEQSGEQRPKAQLSFKLRSAQIAHLPLPKPLFEIFVFSPRVEGVHLRMGKVARGGLRWSDRREDFRTEVLGLMKAQNVKNSVIVPMGAKGGFVPKQIAAGAGRDEVQREGIECYRSFVRGLLDITDNIVAGNTVPPPDVVRHDEDDPYLVVAADKGTATFSDIANAVAAEYQFWLGDAFASGGSAGYDHKKMAITARGAWECTKRHCREIGIDVEAQEFTVCGIGDMAGDVFGNGLLRSPHMKLLAAFNHQHIFLDPTPNAARSFQERQRLFNLPRSTWEDYDARLISKGGGIYARNAKSIALSNEARQVLGIVDSTMTPHALIQAILRMPVDLLWNGGIGTYVKASDEAHAEVGDRSNDAVRVNGRELRCKVVAEGGNLGFTQRGRIEYALQGGRLNTDFIDNSAGVDCSDHEVNIKILLSLAGRELPTARRNALLASMTEDMSKLVLRDNYLQSLALSMSEQVASARLQEHAHLIRSLEQTYGLDRGLEALPDSETIAQRKQTQRGLVRPELAVLLSYSKLALYQHLLTTDVADDPYLAQELQRYFPPRLSARFAKQLPRHRLAREIIATAVTNSLVNRMGPSFALRTEEETGANAASIARAYTIAREIFDMRALWSAIEALDQKIPATLQYRMLNASSRLLRFVTYWLLNQHPQQLHIEQQVARLKPGIMELMQALPQLNEPGITNAVHELRTELQTQQVPSTVALPVSYLDLLCAAPDIVELSAQHRRTVTDTARLYFGLNQLLPLHWLGAQIVALRAQDRWQALARNTLRDQLYRLQRSLCAQLLRAPTRDVSGALQRWQQQQTDKLRIGQQVLAEIQTGTTDFASLSVALQSVRKLVES